MKIIGATKLVTGKTGAMIKRELLATGLPRSNAKELNDYLKSLQTRSAETARDHYEGLLKAGEEFLESPAIGSIRSSSTKRRLVQVPLRLKPRGKALDAKVNTETWKRLTEPYIQRKPKSITFWHKTGRLFSLYSAAIARLQSVYDLKKYLDPAKRKKTDKGVEVQFKTAFPEAGKYLTDILRDPMVTGVYPTIPRPSASRQEKERTLIRVRFPEFYRPFLRRLAIMTGASLRKDMANLGTRRR